MNTINYEFPSTSQSPVLNAANVVVVVGTVLATAPRSRYASPVDDDDQTNAILPAVRRVLLFGMQTNSTWLF